MSGKNWAPGTAYAAGDIIEPPSIAAFGYECTVAGKSGLAEPTWPTTAGSTVTDGGVTWTARAAIVLTWTARALYKSGATEPTWNTVYGGSTTDGNITWTTRTPQITDAKCPNGTAAIAVASKIYSGYRDVVRYCATDNPRDWSATDDAGFVPSGLSAPTSPETSALGEYRGRLVIFTPSHLQLWDADPDPANIRKYDSIAGFGTIYPNAVVSVVDDLYFVTEEGIRSLSISATSNNLRSGDVGSGIDPLVVAKLAGPDKPLGTYYPGNGQAWFIFANEGFIYTRSRLGKIGAWSRYVWPWTIDATTQLNGNLYLRSGNTLYRVDESAVDDAGTLFEGVIWTPYLELGSPGSMKFVDSIDIVGYGRASMQAGYDQSNSAAYTDPYLLPEDSVSGGRVPLPVAGPSLSFKMTYAGGQAWQLNALTVYVNDAGTGV